MPPRAFALERYFARYEFTAPHLLCCSDCEPLSLGEVLALADEDALRRWHTLTLGYTESAGSAWLRERVACMYEHIQPDDLIVLTPEEGIFIATSVLLRPGDRVVATFPGYQSLYELASHIGCELAQWTPRATADGWRFECDDLAELVTGRTRMVVTNFPHNPTGATLSRAELERVVALARQSGAVLFSDEMYRCAEHDPADRLPAACDLYERAISLSGMSKSLSLPGLRIGWLATHDREALLRAQTFRDYTTICCAAPSEILAGAALSAQEQILARNRAIIGDNLRLLEAFFARTALQFVWRRPAAGTIAFCEWRGEQPIDAFCRELVEQRGVMLLPASVYGFPGNHFRIGFGRKNLPVALAELETWLTARC